MSPDARPPVGTVRFRSYRTRGLTATDPAQALDTALDLARNTDRDLARAGERMLHGLALRPDLPAEILTRLCEAADETRSWSLKAALVENLAVRDLPMVRNLLDPDMIPILLDTDPDRFAVDIIRLIDQPRLGSRHGFSPEEISDVRTRLGTDRIQSALDTLIDTGHSPDVHAAASSTLLTPHGFDRLIDRVTDSDSPDRDGSLLDTLARRPDLTMGQAKQIFAAARTLGRVRDRQHEMWPLNTLAANPHAPAEAFNLLLTHRLKWVRNHALGFDHVPDSARWHAATRHYPHAILKHSGHNAIPTDAATAVLDDLDAGMSRHRPIATQEAKALAKALAKTCRTPDLWGRLLAVYTRLHDGDAATAARTFLADATSTGMAAWIEARTATTRKERMLVEFAAHPDGAVRAVVVPYIHDPDDLAEAATDPAPEVRRAVARHKALDQGTLLALAEDSDRQVREIVAERVLVALGAPAADPDSDLDY